MATYGFNTDLTPKIQGTNLSDMINMARGVQAYQQAEEINPLAVQKTQMEIEQAKKLNPLAVEKTQEEVAQAKTLTKKGTLGLSQDQSKIINENIGSVLNDKRLTDTDPQKRATPLLEARQRVINSGVDPVMAEIMFAPVIDKAMRDKNPNAVTDMLSNIKNIQQSGIGATGQQALQTPSLVTTPGGPATFQTGQNVLTPAQISGQQQPPQQPPQAPPQGQPQTQPQGQPQGQPSGVTPIQMSLQYPVRRLGDIRPYAPSEKYDEEKGQAYRDTLANEARNLTTYRRSTDEVIREAEKIGKEEWNQGAGFIGKMGRNFSTFLGTDQGIAYKNLSKALANVQMNSMKALGLSTDADKTLSAAANGDYTYPPEVLAKIASQAHGNMTNIELQTKGAEAFAKKYGDSNQKTFQDLWNSNSKDTRVFEAIAINDSNISKEQKIKKIDKLLENMSPTEIDALTKAKNKLLKLSKTGEL